MNFATWNVNSLKVRLPHVLDWLAARETEGAPIDVLALQETKLTDDKFPVAEIEAAGYQVAFIGQKTYNGVALLSRTGLSDVQFGIPAFADEQRRVVSATVNGVRIVGAYFPNGQALDSEKYPYKLRWLDALIEWLEDEIALHPKLVLMGDYNIAPEDRDVHDPKAWEGQVLVSPPERAAFARLQALGLADAYRLFPQADKTFSWWDYRQLGFRLNKGMRIDHILLTAPLCGACSACVIDKQPRNREQPSDHTPVIATVSV